MDVVKFFFYMFLGILLLSLHGELAYAHGDHSMDGLKGIQQSSECAHAVEQNILRNLGSPPKFKDLKAAINWTRLHLPRSIQLAIGNAAEDTLLISGYHLKNLRTPPGLLYRALLATTSTNIAAMGSVKLKICAGLPISRGRKFMLKSALWSFLVANHENAVASDLYQMAGENMYFASKLFLLMLTLDATTKQWEPSWLDNAKEVQAELSRKLDERVKRNQRRAGKN